MVLGYLHIIEFGKWGSSLYLIRWENKKRTFLQKKLWKCLQECPIVRTFATALREMLLTTTKQKLKNLKRGNSSVGRARPCQGRGRGSESRLPLIFWNRWSSEKFYFKRGDTRSGTSIAQVAELVDAHVSGACVSRRAGSSPVLGTICFRNIFLIASRRGGGIGRRATLRG